MRMRSGGYYPQRLASIALKVLLAVSLTGFSPAVASVEPIKAATSVNDLPLIDTAKPTELVPGGASTSRYTDLNRRIQNEVIDDEPVVTRDIAILWQAAVERNPTIRFAIEKLSRKDATGKQAVDPWTKKLIGSLVNLGGVAGSVLTQSPAGIMGSNVLQEAISSGPADLSRLPITDADMVILAKTVDELQSHLFKTYLTYKKEKRLLTLSLDTNRVIKRQLNTMDTPTTDALQDVTLQDAGRYQQAYASARTALTLLAGPDAVAAMEQPAPSLKN